MIIPALERGGYAYDTQQHVGQRLGGGRHVVDAIAERDENRFLISLKWQQVSGTAEQKVPFEVICLAEAIPSGGFVKAYLVLGGEGWTLRDYYTRGGLRDYLVNCESVEIKALEAFVALANKGQL